MFAAFLLSMLLLGNPPTGASDPVYAEVERQIQRGELTAAEATLEKAIAANDKDFQAHLLLGIVFEEEGHPRDALQHLNRARELSPRDPASYVNIGRVLASQGELESAAEQFSTAVRLDPDNATARSNWGLVLYHQQRWHEAITQLRKAVALKPTDSASLGLLFQACLEAGDFASARAAAVQIEHLSPPSSETFRTLGALQGKAGDYPDAVQNLKKALAMDPDSAEAAYNLSLALLREGKVDDARRQLESLRDTKDNGEVEDLLGEAFESQQRPLDAVRAYERAVALEPQNEDYNFAYVTELLFHKSYEAAILVANAAVRNIPGSVRLRLALVAALHGADKSQQAHAVLIQASRQFPDSSLPLYLRSVLAEREKQADTGLAEEVEHYVSTHPGDSLALLTLGRERDRQGDLKGAIAALNQSLAAGKESAEAQLTIARVYFELQDWPQVIVHSRRAVALRPDMREAWYRLARALDRAGRKSEGDAAMKHFIDLKAEQTQSPVSTFIYTLR